jgi:hypothetical protein
MNKEKDKAATSAKATASTNNLHTESYRNIPYESRAKLEIGTLLLALQSPLSQKQQKICWALFEARLRQYLDLRICEVAL